MLDDNELRISFVGAKNKREQVGVLADLNVCPPREIAERLDAMGLLSAEGLCVEQFSARYRPAGKAALPPIDEVRAMELYSEGMDDIAIGDALGVGPRRVKDWRPPEPTPEPAPAPEPVPEPAPVALSVQMFIAALKEMLTPRAAQGSLWLNGVPVREIASVRIRPCGDGMIVDVEVEG